jgi:hypothetical protein
LKLLCFLGVTQKTIALIVAPTQKLTPFLRSSKRIGSEQAKIDLSLFLNKVKMTLVQIATGGVGNT